MARQGTNGSNLLSPAELDGRGRRRSTLSQHGFFIDYTRRQSSAAAARNQLVQAECATRGGHSMFGATSGAQNNYSHRQPAIQQQHYKHQLSQPSSPSRGLSLETQSSSPVGLLGGQLRLVAPAALMGSRKTSIFDPAGHSLSARTSAESGPGQPAGRRCASMVAGASGPSAAEQVLLAGLAQRARRAGAGPYQGRQLRVEQVPVIGCSPTSIEASLAALEATRRCERLVRALERRRASKQRRQRRRSPESAGGRLARPAASRQASPQGGRRPLRALRSAASSLLLGRRGSRPSRPEQEAEGAGAGESESEPEPEPSDQDKLSVSSMSLDQSEAELSELGASVSSLDSWLAELEQEAAQVTRRASEGGARQAGSANLVGAALRRLSNLSIRPGGAPTRGSRRAPKAAPGALDYWYYYYYLRENSLERADSHSELPFLLAGAAGSSLRAASPFSGASSSGGAGGASSSGPQAAQLERRARIHINYSLARLLIVGAAGEPLAGSHLLGSGAPPRSDQDEEEQLSLALSSSSSSSPSASSSSSSSASSPSSSSSGSSAATPSRSFRDSGPSSPQSNCSALTSAHLDQMGAASRPRHASQQELWRAQARQPNQLGPAQHQRLGLRSASCAIGHLNPAAQEEPMDDFERLSRCHRGFVAPTAPSLDSDANKRNSRQRLSVRSARSGAGSVRRRRSRLEAQEPQRAASMFWTPQREAQAAAWCSGLSRTDPHREACSQRSLAPQPTCDPLRPVRARSQTLIGGPHTGARPTDTWRRAPEARVDLFQGSQPTEKDTPVTFGAEIRARAHSTGARAYLGSRETQSDAAFREFLLASTASKRVQVQSVPSAEPIVPDSQAAKPGSNGKLDHLRQSKRRLLSKRFFRCLVVGSRQTGKRTIVKCFMKLLNEFKLAATEYRKEKLLAKLLGCSEHMEQIMECRRQQEQEATDAGARENHENRRRSRLNSWFGNHTPINKLLVSSAGKHMKPRHSSVGQHQHQQQQQQQQQQQLQRLQLERRRHTSAHPNQTTSLNETYQQSSQHQASSHGDPWHHLCVMHSESGVLLGANLANNRSDTNINYHPEQPAFEQVQFRVPVRPVHSVGSSHCLSNEINDQNCMESQDDALSPDISMKRSRTRRSLRQLLSLRELNKRRVRVRFQIRRQLAKIESAVNDNNVYSGLKSLFDIYLVVYSVNDRDSFEFADRLLERLKALGLSEHLPCVLVANKIDLERAKVVEGQEGRALARKHRCKFIEVSCTVGFNLDNLLVGVRTQLVLSHHAALNSAFRSQDQSDKPGHKKEPNARQKKSGLNILTRLYKRYLINQDVHNYDCDNFLSL